MNTKRITSDAVAYREYETYILHLYADGKLVVEYKPQFRTKKMPPTETLSLGVRNVEYYIRRYHMTRNPSYHAPEGPSSAPNSTIIGGRVQR